MGDTIQQHNGLAASDVFHKDFPLVSSVAHVRDELPIR